MDMQLSGQTHIARAGDTFDKIALEVYGDEKYAAQLMMANGEHLDKYPFGGGEVIALPVVYAPEETEEGELGYEAPWKEGAS